jgi:hypothetical protein
MEKVTVNINVEYGSEFQQDFFMKILQVMLDAIMMHMDRSHSKNKMSYEIDTHDGYKRKKI